MQNILHLSFCEWQNCVDKRVKLRIKAQTASTKFIFITLIQIEFWRSLRPILFLTVLRPYPVALFVDFVGER